MSAAALVGTAQGEESDQARTVISVEEYEDIKVPPELIFLAGKLDIYPAVQNGGYLRVKLAKDALSLQAGGLIGYVPLNARLALDIKTRVPVSNLERLVSMSGVPTPPPLPFLKAYATTEADVSPVLDIVTNQFCTLVERLEFEGLFKTYDRVKRISSSPSGRIFAFETSLRTAIAQKPLAAFERFERTTDNPPNQIILHALRYLSALYRQAGQRKGVPLIRSRLARSENLFANVSYRSDRSFTNVALVRDIAQHAEYRPVLRQLVVISQFLLRGHGVAFRGEGDDIELPSIVLRMDKVFEGYLLRTFQLRLQLLPGYAVLDGNTKPPTGGEGRLFDVLGAGMQNPATNPDIVITKNGAALCVIDAKYKVCPGAPEREDLNQIISYALAHNVKRAVLAYPAAKQQATEILPLGVIRGIHVFQSTIALGVADLLKEEEAICAKMHEAVDSAA